MPIIVKLLLVGFQRPGNLHQEVWVEGDRPGRVRDPPGQFFACDYSGTIIKKGIQHLARNLFFRSKARFALAQYLINFMNNIL